jgi:hypothetical protein
MVPPLREDFRFETALPQGEGDGGQISQGVVDEEAACQGVEEGEPGAEARAGHLVHPPAPHDHLGGEEDAVAAEAGGKGRKEGGREGGKEGGRAWN